MYLWLVIDLGEYFYELTIDYAAYYQWGKY